MEISCGYKLKSSHLTWCHGSTLPFPATCSLFAVVLYVNASHVQKVFFQDWKYFSWFVKSVSAMSTVHLASRVSCQFLFLVSPGKTSCVIKLENQRNQRQTRDLHCTCSAFEKSCNRQYCDMSVALTSCIPPVSICLACLLCVCVCVFLCIWLLPLCTASVFSFFCWFQLVYAVSCRMNAIICSFIACLWFNVSKLTFMIVWSLSEIQHESMQWSSAFCSELTSGQGGLGISWCML